MQSRIISVFIRLSGLSVALVFLGFVFVSCDNNRYYEHSEAIVDNTWFYDDAKAFELEIEDSLQAFNFYVNVRNTVDYEFANLYFFIKSE